MPNVGNHYSPVSLPARDPRADDAATMWPYLHLRTYASLDPGILDLNPLLAATAPISWGALLGALPESSTTSLLAKACHANSCLQPSA